MSATVWNPDTLCGTRGLLGASGLRFVLTVSPAVPLVIVAEYVTSLPSGQSPGPFLIDLKHEREGIMGVGKEKEQGYSICTNPR